LFLFGQHRVAHRANRGSLPAVLRDFVNDRCLVPFGLGFGKVLKLGNAIANAFVGPQFAVYDKGSGQPSLQLFTELNLQWARN
jgi:hypothetical protein